VLFHCNNGCTNRPQCYVIVHFLSYVNYGILCYKVAFSLGQYDLEPSYTAVSGSCSCSSFSCKTAVAFVSEYAKQVVVGAALTHHTGESVCVVELNSIGIVPCAVSCRARTLIRLLRAPVSLRTHTA
jgi:hypothetical protein